MNKLAVVTALACALSGCAALGFGDAGEGEGEGAAGGEGEGVGEGEGLGEGEGVGGGEGEGEVAQLSFSGTCPFTPPTCASTTATCDGIDVAEPHADVVNTRAFTNGTDAIFQLFFAAPPFDPSDADFCSLLLDTDGDPNTGQSGGTGGDNPVVFTFDAFVTVTPGGVEVPQNQPFPTEVIIAGTVMQIRIPLTAATHDGVLRWAIVSAFGGSGGANDAVPNSGGAFLSSSDALGADQLCVPQ